ncbi:MAG: MBL fold metallo-hydrolase [Salibacteraceae bacterium]
MNKLWKWLKRLIVTIVVLLLVAVIGTTILLQQPQFGAAPSEEEMVSLLESPQHTGEKFQNPGGITTTISFGKGLSLIPTMLSDEGEKSPTGSLPIHRLDWDSRSSLADTSTRVTWLGHSSFLLEMEGKTILLDPMFGANASPVGFMAERFPESLPITAEQLPAVDLVLFSHDHYDHLDYPTILSIKDKVGQFLVPLGLGAHLQHWGVSKDKIIELDWWEEVTLLGLELACTPSQHFSGRGLMDRDQTLWCSWVIHGKRKKIFFSGDSGYFGGFKKIGEKYGPFDLTLLECGQYYTLWTEIHMLPEQTFQANLDLKGKALMPIHWGTFQLALHPWFEPVERLSVAANAQPNVPVVTPIIGQSIELGTPLPQEKWWREYMTQ